MRLEDLYQDFSALPHEEQVMLIAVYRERRALDMLKPSTYKKKKSSSSASKPKTSLTDEEKSVMKLLGLTRKQMLDLRASMQQADTSPDDEEDMTSLLSDDCFEEEE